MAKKFRERQSTSSIMDEVLGIKHAQYEEQNTEMVKEEKEIKKIPEQINLNYSNADHKEEYKALSERIRKNLLAAHINTNLNVQSEFNKQKELERLHGTKNRRVQLLINETVYDDLKTLAKREHISVNEEINRLVKKRLYEE